MRQHHRKPVLACFGQDRREAVSAEIVKLINRQKKIEAIIFWFVGTRQCRQLELSNQDGSEEIGLVSAEPSLREVRDKDSPIVHNETRIHTAADLTQDVAQWR